VARTPAALRLREALASMMSHLRGLPADPQQFFVTRGSQGAVDLVARALIKPGDVVAIEALGYRPAWGALEAAGAKLVAVPLDEHGMRVEAIPKGVRAVYLTPHHQYPTTVTLSPGRRITLLERARVERFAILEDDYDFEFHYEGRPVLPLACADRAGVVIYIGTLSKILAPGLRLGFVAAPSPLLDRLAAVRTLIDRQGDQAIELAVAELLEDSEVQRHARRVRRVYRERRDVLVDALKEKLPQLVLADPPAGGMALWIRVRDVDVDEWAARSLAAGVAFYPARSFAFDGRSRPFARMGFASLEPRELREAVKRMASVVRTRRSA
jgi:GntR family transcriptional regulator / MocR family aminotransferase